MIVIIVRGEMDAFDKLIRYLDGPPVVSQQKFADMVGAKQGVVSLWYRRLRRPGTEYIPALNRILGTTLEGWIKARLEDIPGSRRRAS